MEWNIAIYCAQVERNQDSASNIVLRNTNIDAFWELAFALLASDFASFSGLEIGTSGAALAASPFEENHCFKFIPYTKSYNSTKLASFPSTGDTITST